MSKIVYIGRTTDFKGKSLWEIVGNLKNFGVGRIVVRSMFERYPEPSYFKILKVQAVNHEENRRVKVTVEKTFRNRKFPQPIEIYSSSYKTDYRLLSKDEEEAYCKRNNETVEEKILPQTIEFPPLLKQFIIEETKNLDPKLNLKIYQCRDKLVRIAKDGEIPNVTITPGLGKPKSPKLYENLV